MSILAILGLILTIFIIYDIWAKNNQLDSTQKLIWTLAAVFFNVITAIIYFFAYIQKRK